MESKVVFFILWFGRPIAFDDYRSAKIWLMNRCPTMHEDEIKISINVCEVFRVD